MKKIGITIGDPAGVSPELIVRLSKFFKEESAYVIYGDEKILTYAMEQFNLSFPYKRINTIDEVKNPGVYVADLNISEVPRPEPSINSGKVAVAYLGRAVVDAVCGNIDGLLTMPISKFWAKRAGFSYEGQTEFLAQASRVDNFAMMMYSEKISVVLMSTHIPLKEVPEKISRENLSAKLELIDREFNRFFSKKPVIGVLGLNPHAGEGGDIGDEEVGVIFPVIEEKKKEGFAVEGPLVPDTAFLKHENYDVFLCMYHDQGLIPFKMLAFNEGVNLTLGLPFVRTSPDHGTAYDIAWKGIADVGASKKALELCEELVGSGGADGI